MLHQHHSHAKPWVILESKGMCVIFQKKGKKDQDI